MARKTYTLTERTQLYDRAIQSLLQCSDGTPQLGNVTPQAMVDTVGEWKELEKQLKAKIELFTNVIDAKTKFEPVVEGDRFIRTIKPQPRTALNQTMAKETLSILGRLEEHMSTVEVQFHYYDAK